jgi:hypothetical protein
MQNFDLNNVTIRLLDLQDAARFYAEVFELWEHYREVLKLNAHVVRYEDVVSDFRPAVAKLLESLGLDWDDAVLEYDRTARAKTRIHTPSYAQVSQKIYTSSSGRWQRYRSHLESILPILGPHALRYGYLMDSARAWE